MDKDTAAPKKPRPHSLEGRRPEIVKDLIFDLANPILKIPQKELCEKYGITHDNIQNFRRRHKEEIDTLRDEIALGQWENMGDNFKLLAYMAVERSKEALGKASAKDAAVVAGLSIDKVLLLENKGVSKISVIHEHRHSVAGVLELLANEMKRRGIGPEELPAQEVKVLPPADDSDEPSPE